MYMQVPNIVDKPILHPSLHVCPPDLVTAGYWKNCIYR